MDTEKSPLNRALAAEIRAERTAQKIPVAELARRARMVLGTLNRVLAGKRDINITQLGSIARALEVTPETLMRRAVERMGGLEVLFADVDAGGESDQGDPSMGDLVAPEAKRED